MPKYRVTFVNKEIQAIDDHGENLAAGDTILENRTGDTIYATVEAASPEEARQKAEAVQRELQTSVPKDAQRNSPQ